MLPMKRGYTFGVQLPTHCINCQHQDNHWYVKQPTNKTLYAVCPHCGFMVAESNDNGKCWIDDSEGDESIAGAMYRLGGSGALQIPTTTKFIRGRKVVLPMERIVGHRLETRQSWWETWQLLGLPCPDLVTGKVEIVPARDREQFKRFIEMSKKESAK